MWSASLAHPLYNHSAEHKLIRNEKRCVTLALMTWEHPAATTVSTVVGQSSQSVSARLEA